MSAPDYRDSVIETLADSEAELIERIVDLEVQVRIWREIAQQAIHALHEREIQIRRARESVRLLREDQRRRCLKEAR